MPASVPPPPPVRRPLLGAATAAAVAAVVVLAPMVLLAPAAHAAEGWDSGRELGQVADTDGVEPGSTGEQSSRGQGTTAAHGQRLAAVWVDARRVDPFTNNHNTEVTLRSSDDSGASFGPLRPVTQTPEQDWEPALAFGRDAILVAAGTAVNTSCGGCPNTSTLVRVAPEGTLTRTQQPSASGDPVIMNSLAADPAAGTAAYAYGERNVTVAVSTDDGASWTEQRAVPGARSLDFQGTYPAVAVTGTTTTVVWRQAPVSGAHTDLMAATSTDGGQSWSEPVAVTSTPQREMSAAVGYVGSTLVAAWHTSRSATSTTFDVATSADHGRTWSTPRVLHDGQFDTSQREPRFRPLLHTDTTTLTLAGFFEGAYLSTSDGQQFTDLGVDHRTGNLARTGDGKLWLSTDGSKLHTRYSDSTAPTATLIGGPDVYTRIPNHRFTVQSSDDHDRPEDLRITCSISSTSGRANVSNCGQMIDVSSSLGTHTLVVNVADRLGNSSRTSRTWTLDPNAPQPAAPTATAGRFTTRPTIALKLSARDASGVAYFDVQVRRGAPGQPLGTATVPSHLSRLAASGSARTVNVSLPSGADSCFAVRAADPGGNLSGWSGETCVARAFDDRGLAATTGGWNRVAAAGTYNGTLTSTGKRGSALISRGLFGTRLALIATRCPSCGSVEVMVGTSRLTTVSLYAPTTQRQAIVNVPAFSHRRTDVTLRVVSSGKPVHIDGLGIAKR